MSISKSKNKIILSKDSKHLRIFAIFSLLIGLVLFFYINQINLSLYELFWLSLISVIFIVLGLFGLIKYENKSIVVSRSDKSINFSSQKIFNKYSKSYNLKEIKNILLTKVISKHIHPETKNIYYLCKYTLVFVLNKIKNSSEDNPYFDLGETNLTPASFSNFNNQKLKESKEIAGFVLVPLKVLETFDNKEEITNSDKLSISMFLNKNKA